MLTRSFYMETVEFATGFCDGIDPLKKGGISGLESAGIFGNTPPVRVQKPSYGNP